MNKKVKVTLGILVLGATTVYAASGTAGTDADPLVTKSYVDQKIASISGGNTSDLEAKITAQQALIDSLLQEVEDLKQASSTYQVVYLEEGQKIYGAQGAEMIIRAGTANILGSDNGGIQDVTDGVDLSNGTAAPRFNLLLVPRGDGRGLLATTKLTVMVRGGYTIV